MKGNDAATAEAREFRRAAANVAIAALRLDATPPRLSGIAATAWADLEAARAAIDRALSRAPRRAGDGPEGGTP